MKGISRFRHRCFLAVCGLFFFCMSVPGADKKEVLVEIPVCCMAEDCSETFECYLEPEESPYQKPERYRVRLKDGEKGAFRLRYTYPGTYHCIIGQKAGKTEGVQYDGSIYHVSVFITEEEEGGMEAKITVFPDSSREKSSACQFENRKIKKEKIPAEKKPDTTSPQSVQTGDRLCPEYWCLAAFLAFMTARIVCKLKIRKEGRM